MNPERIALDVLLDAGGGHRLKKLAGRIMAGAVFIYPTETIYGLGGGYGIPGVAEKIQAIKGRVRDHPLILVASDVSFFSTLDLKWTHTALRLAEQFWPGMLTLVLPRKSGGDLAVRVSPHRFIAALFSGITTPLYSTSANVSGEPYDPDPETIFRKLGTRVDFMIDAGRLPHSLPSTVLKVFDNGCVTVLREGAVPSAALMQEQK
ncbi:MAG: L-threonylcarbamoyladenylate synthase [Chitinispirillaceae bacterium]|nr:L-threonylcarbamoyladenylate synthase [Chitinispirillaceae bacterium]